MNQSLVKEIYLRVIDATIEGSRTEFTEKGVDDNTLESLNLLKKRWAERLTRTHDFSEDPNLIDRPSSSTAKGGKKSSSKHAKKKGLSPRSPKSPSKASSSRNGVLSVASLTNQTNEPTVLSTTPTSIPGSAVHLGKPEPFLQRQRDVKTEGEPPAKRPRQDIDIGPIDHGGEDLDSEDSDEEDNDSDEEAENIILAQHDRVKKGPKWKVILREGIVSIRGREYLFNKATCDLDF